MLFKQVLIIAAIFGFAAAEVPSYFKVCGAKNPHLDDCVIESVASLKEQLRDGIPELDIPPADPLVIGKIVLVDMPNFHAVGRNVQLRGLSNFHISHLHVDLEKHQIDLEVQFPECNMDALYNITAKILVPIVGTGPIRLSSKNVIAKVHMVFKLVEHDGKRYIYFPLMTTRLELNDYKFDFEAENFDKTLQDAMKQAFGSSREEILEAMKPNVEKAISQMCLNMSNKICKHFTYDELFPDRE